MSSSEAITTLLKQHNISEVECLIPDITGNARGKFIPANKFIKEDSRLPEVILAQTISGEWTSLEDGLLDASERDMFLQPDESAARLVPWANEPTMQIIHDCFDSDGNPHRLASRNVLKKVLEFYDAEGWQPVVAPEIEFYIVSKNTDPAEELMPPIGRTGRRERSGQAFSIDATNEYDPFVESLYAYSDAQNLSLDTLVHEDGLGQLEVNLLHGDALQLADEVFTFKRTARHAALNHDMYATFMAKPMGHQPGSAMHIHQSIIDKNTGQNIFSAADGSESALFRNYIGGLQKYTPSIMALYAPNVNSYRRFTKDSSCPINLDWAYDNRTTGIRIPDSSAAARRVENRFPGIDCNPYLAIAASLACGYLGMKNGTKPGKPLKGELDDDAQIILPRTLEAALRCLHDDEEIIELLGKDFIQVYYNVKQTEYETFNRHISAWEREFLLLNV